MRPGGPGRSQGAEGAARGSRVQPDTKGVSRGSRVQPEAEGAARVSRVWSEVRGRGQGVKGVTRGPGGPRCRGSKPRSRVRTEVDGAAEAGVHPGGSGVSNS